MQFIAASDHLQASALSPHRWLVARGIRRGLQYRKAWHESDMRKCQVSLLSPASRPGLLSWPSDEPLKPGRISSPNKPMVSLNAAWPLMGVLFGSVCSVSRRLQPVSGLLSEPPPLPHGPIRRSHPGKRRQSQVTLPFWIVVLKSSFFKLLKHFANMIKKKKTDVLLLLICVLFDTCACFNTKSREVATSSAVHTCFCWFHVIMWKLCGV